jgi:TetR/AcrR family transcriptional regulator, regulator of autoinduction and epiphytic fitness
MVLTIAPLTAPTPARSRSSAHAQASAVLTAPATRDAIAPSAVATAQPATSLVATKPSFKQQMLQAREEAIVDVVNRMLADKGFDAMTVDEVAAEVGVAKASLYKHFPSKEDLAAAAMVRMMQRAQVFLGTISPTLSAIDKLKLATRWMMQLKLAGEMPNLPSQNSSLRTKLTAHRGYVDGLISISDTLGGWIEAAQKAGEISTKLPAMVVLYTLYARACDPVLEFLKMGGQYSNVQMLDFVCSTCFDGLATR